MMHTMHRALALSALLVVCDRFPRLLLAEALTALRMTFKPDDVYLCTLSGYVRQAPCYVRGCSG